MRMASSSGHACRLVVLSMIMWTVQREKAHIHAYSATRAMYTGYESTSSHACGLVVMLFTAHLDLPLTCEIKRHMSFVLEHLLPKMGDATADQRKRVPLPTSFHGVIT